MPVCYTIDHDAQDIHKTSMDMADPRGTSTEEVDEKTKFMFKPKQITITYHKLMVLRPSITIQSRRFLCQKLPFLTYEVQNSNILMILVNRTARSWQLLHGCCQKIISEDWRVSSGKRNNGRIYGRCASFFSLNTSIWEHNQLTHQPLKVTMKQTV